MKAKGESRVKDFAEKGVEKGRDFFLGKKALGFGRMQREYRVTSVF